ncbi:MAG: carbohydrate ABC transporter permease, partial [Bacteroidota bacterium]
YNTAFYTLFAVPLGIIVGLTLAVLQNVRVPGVRYFRTIFYLPAVLTGVPVYMLWLWILNPQGGLVNAALGLFGITGPAWLADANWAKPGYILMSSWGACAGSLMYLAALKGIPSQMYEVAELDGARGLRRFFAITVPLISPVIFFRLVTGISGSLQMFAPALVMSESGAGGPSDSTLFYGLYLWRRAFVELNMGYASAMAWFLLGLVLVLTVIQLKLQHRWVFYEGGEK